ncbi:Stp1/IreP family PP2C-type Ser/Thr phosphatase [Ferrimicrobium sp.]|uniref:Stp1/IreP family PP2C-type Ser/Thr phosphatase n=1 Tax=Ferrimicrobium sp. TaxID=2926050 RepID=UPI00263717CF|nr:Stp1/IreP family PP2C-type Ser/Thr phosphatase [Ferrimicrobium sp.]
MNITYAAATDPGRVRSQNQDRLFADGTVFIVADGMGGHAGGNVAAEVAVSETVASLKAGHRPEIAIENANRSILDRASSELALEGMGTTLTMALIDTEESLADVYNVGDSRAYLLRAGDLTQLTNDHTFVQELVDAGSITREQATTHRARHVLTRVLGVATEVEPDHFRVPLQPGDVVLLCSDGLINEVSNDEIARILASQTPDDAVDALVRSANNHGGNDNITVVVAKVENAGRGAIQLADYAEEPAPLPQVVPPSERALQSHRIPSPLPNSMTQRSGISRPLVRATLFLVLLLAFAGVVVLAIDIYVQHSYFVAALGNRVAIYQGRPGGVLWFNPHVVDLTSVRLSQLAEGVRSQITHGIAEGSLAQAKQFVQNATQQFHATTLAFGGLG